jgi:uncharacterized protein YjbI with pentapeptide repeats
MSHNHAGENHQKAKFSGQNLTKANFSDSDLRGAKFIKSNLCNANFTNAKLHGADFSCANLRGARFIEASIREPSENSNCSPFSVNFSKTSIQGTDFTNAQLNHANFYKAKAGLNSFHSCFVGIVTLIICLLSSFSSTIASTFAIYYFFRDFYKRTSIWLLLPTWIGSVIFIVSLRTIALHVPILIGSKAITYHMVFGLVLIFLTIVVVSITTIERTKTQDDSRANIGYVFIIVILLIVMIALSLYPSIWKGTENSLVRQFPSLEILVKGLGATSEGKWVAGIIGAVLGGGLGCWFSYLALRGHKGFSVLWKMYVEFAALGGTIFSGANLSDVNFTDASLKGVKFKNDHSNIETTHYQRTRWYNARYLEYASIGEHPYLTIPKVQRLVIKQEARKLNHDDIKFDGLDLEGINLEGANLSEASFVGTNLNKANLRGADLAHANLRNAKLDRTDLTGAILTGACIKDWTITPNTRLDNIECEYIFLEEHPNPKTGIRSRLPHAPNKNFQPGEFERRFRQPKETLQLFIRDDNNREALAAAFLGLVENQAISADALRQGIETVENDVLVNIPVSQETDLATVEEQFDRTYQSQLERSGQGIKQTPGLQKILEDVNINSNQTLFDFIVRLIQVIGENMSVPPNFTTNINNPSQSPITIGSGSSNHTEYGTYIGRDYINMSQDLTQAATEIQQLLEKLQTQEGVTVDDAKNTIGTELGNQAKSNETIKQRLRNWGASLATGTVNEVIISSVIRTACGIAGITLP